MHTPLTSTPPLPDTHPPIASKPQTSNSYSIFYGFTYGGGCIVAPSSRAQRSRLTSTSVNTRALTAHICLCFSTAARTFSGRAACSSSGRGLCAFVITIPQCLQNVLALVRCENRYSPMSALSPKSTTCSSFGYTQSAAV